jgi:hypothetical protein
MKPVIYNASMSRGLHRISQKALLRYGRRVERAARRLVPVDTGALKESLHVELGTAARGTRIVRVGSDLYYAAWVHRGTGIYGPHKQRIYPRRARYLVFTVKDGTLVFATSVRGQRGQPYLSEALKEVFTS